MLVDDVSEVAGPDGVSEITGDGTVIPGVVNGVVICALVEAARHAVTSKIGQIFSLECIFPSGLRILEWAM